MIIAKIGSNRKKFRNVSMNSTCNCGTCNCNCGSQNFPSKTINLRLDSLKNI